MEYKYPDKMKFIDAFLANYGLEFLELNNLSIGSEVEMDFKYEGLRQNPKSKEYQIFRFDKKGKGVVKSNSKGALFIESLEDMDFYISKGNGRTGRDYKVNYHLEKRKAIIKIGSSIF